MANGLMAHLNVTSSEHFLNHPQAQRKAEIEPDGITDYLDWEAMPAIERVTRLFHNPT
jgi:hypothetical protein